MRKGQPTQSIFTQYSDDHIENHQLEAQTKYFDPVKFLTVDEIITQLESHVTDISDIFCIDFDYALLVFMKLKLDRYNKHLLETEFTLEKEDLLKQLGISLEKDSSKEFMKQRQVGQCKSCFDDQCNLISLGCGHFFCQDCWKANIKTKCSEKISQITCMNEGCNKPILYQFVKKIFEDDPNGLKLYQVTLSKQYVEESQLQQISKVSWCPGVDCTYSIEANVIEQSEVSCPLGHVWCVICRSEAHRPVSCAIVKCWNTILNIDNESFQWIKQNTKLCPQCHRPIQKNNGCNQIHCRPPGGCGGNFCYVCNQKWMPQHSDHFRCPFENNVQAPTDIEVKKAFLTTYNYHYRRFHECTQNCEYIKSNIVSFLAEVEQLFVEKLKITPQKMYFLKDSIPLMIDAYMRLKWTYCLTHFLDESGQYDKELHIMACHQQSITSVLEDLTKVIEENFLSHLKVDPLIKKPSKELMKLNHFEKLKDKVFECTKLVTTYKNLLIKEIETLNFVRKSISPQK